MTEYLATKTDLANIGKGEQTLADRADAIVAATPIEFDHTKRGAVADLLRKHVEPGQRMHGPKGEQTPTLYGKGFAALESAVKARLVKRAAGDEPKPVVLRVSLTGEGGGSTTVPADHPLYAELVALIAGQTAEVVDAA